VEPAGTGLSCLSEASLRINESVGVDTVLQTVLTIGQAQGEATLAGRAVPWRRFSGEGMTDPEGKPLPIGPVPGNLSVWAQWGKRPITPPPLPDQVLGRSPPTCGGTAGECSR